MSGTTSFSVRMDKDVKQQSEDIFRGLGVNMTTAINIFLRQAIQAGGFPFEIRQKSPNYQTQMALAEAERLLADPDTKRYSDVEEALKELKS